MESFMASIAITQPSPSQRLGRIADGWERGYQRVPEVVSGGVGAAVAKSGRYFVPIGEISAGAWLASEQGRQAMHLVHGRDGTLWKASTSGTDRVLGTTVHLLLAGVGAGMAVHGAIVLARNIASELEKN
jgi:hypothetical protein